MLLRYYRRPPAFDHKIVLYAVSWLPIALLLHLVIVIITHSESTILKSGLLTSNWESSGVSFSALAGEDSDASTASAYNALYDQLGSSALGTRLLRKNIIPSLLLLCIAIVYLVYRVTLRILFGEAVMVIKACISILKKKKITIAEREWNPPLTEEYSKELSPFIKYKNLLSATEKTKGWKVVGNDGYKQWKVKVWQRSGKSDFNQEEHKKGQRKRSWEVIADEGLHTYRIDQNPHYKDALMVLKAMQCSTKDTNAGFDGNGFTQLDQSSTVYPEN